MPYLVKLGLHPIQLHHPLVKQQRPKTPSLHAREVQLPPAVVTPVRAPRGSVPESRRLNLHILPLVVPVRPEAEPPPRPRSRVTRLVGEGGEQPGLSGEGLLDYGHLLLEEVDVALVGAV